jgi:hypothetical protein
MKLRSGVWAMRVVSVVCFVAAVWAGTVSAEAYEKFIPLGAGYSPEVSTLPAINSTAESVTSQSDVYETELYNKQREDKLRDSQFQRFISDPESSGSDSSIQY